MSVLVKYSWFINQKKKKIQSDIFGIYYHKDIRRQRVEYRSGCSPRFSQKSKWILGPFIFPLFKGGVNRPNPMFWFYFISFWPIDPKPKHIRLTYMSETKSETISDRPKTRSHLAYDKYSFLGKLVILNRRLKIEKTTNNKSYTYASPSTICISTGGYKGGAPGKGVLSIRE